MRGKQKMKLKTKRTRVQSSSPFSMMGTMILCEPSVNHYPILTGQENHYLLWQFSPVYIFRAIHRSCIMIVFVAGFWSPLEEWKTKKLKSPINHLKSHHLQLAQQIIHTPQEIPSQNNRRVERSSLFRFQAVVYVHRGTQLILEFLSEPRLLLQLPDTLRMFPDTVNASRKTTLIMI